MRGLAWLAVRTGAGGVAARACVCPRLLPRLMAERACMQHKQGQGEMAHA